MDPAGRSSDAARSGRKLLWLALCLTAVSLAFLVFAIGRRDPPEGAVEARPEVPVAPPRPAVDRGKAGSERERLPVARVPATASEPAGAPAPSPDHSTARSPWSLLVRVSPAPTPSDPLSGSMQLLDERGNAPWAGGAFDGVRGLLRESGLTQQSYVLEGRFFGYRPIREPIARPTDGDRLETLVELDSVPVVDVRLVRSDGEPLDPRTAAYVNVELHPIDGEAPPDGSWGWFRREWVPGSGSPEILGELDALLPLPAEARLVVEQRTVATETLKPDQEELVFVVDRGALEEGLSRLRCRVVEAGTGEPIPFAEALVASPELSIGRSVVRDGSLVLDPVFPGHFPLTILSLDHAPWTRDVSFPAGGEASLDLIELSPSLDWEVTLLLPDGSPAAGAQLRCQTPETFAWLEVFEPEPVYGYARSDELGIARPNAAPGPNLLVATLKIDGTLYASAIEEADPRRDQGRTLRLMRTTPVRLRTGPGLSPGKYRIHDASGHVVRWGWTLARPRLLRLPPGEYVVDVQSWKDGGVLAESRLVVGDTELDLELGLGDF